MTEFCSCLLSLDSRHVARTERRDSTQPGRATTLNAPRLWLKLLLAVSPRRSRGRPAPLGADGWRVAFCGFPPASAGPNGSCSARGRPRRKAGPAGRHRALRRACPARSDALAPRAPTRTLRALRRAYPVRTDRALATRTTRSSGAQTRASGALSVHSHDARHASPLSHSLCDRYFVHG